MGGILGAFLTSAFICLLTGPFFIPYLRRLKVGQTIRVDGPRRHLGKSGTPTMGGIMFLISITVASYLFTNVSLELAVVLLVIMGYGLIGLADDFLKVVLKRPLGLKARHKLAGQIALALLISLVSVLVLERGTGLQVPLLGIEFPLGWTYFPFAVLVFVASSNAVNLTDGLDGLAAGLTAITAGAFILVSLLMKKYELAIFAAAVTGGCIGFLFYNFHPAKVFMGDTGSLALGAAVASLAVMTRTELILPIVGAVYVVETLSVIIQVLSFRLTGKRIFRMSPIHHHFELIGWSEKKVVLTFWAAGLLAALAGILALFTV